MNPRRSRAGSRALDRGQISAGGRRPAIVAFAIIAAILVATAVLVLAGAETMVLSVHTTDADFNAASVTNMTVVGSGASATVELSTNLTVDGFEDGGISEYSGDTGSYSVSTSSPVFEGSYSLKSSTSTQAILVSTSGLANYPSPGDTVSTDLQITATSNQDFAGIVFGAQDANNFYHVSVEADNNNLKIWKRVSGSYTLLAENTGVSVPSGTHLEVTITWEADGSITASLRDEETGSDLGSVSASDTTYSSGGVGFRNGGDVTVDDYKIIGTGGGGDGEYVHNHSVTNSVAGFTNITTASNVSVTVTWRGDSDGDGSYDSLLNQTSGISTAANHSFSWAEFAGSDVRVNVTVETGVNPQFALAAEGVSATVHSPTVDNASASPSGNPGLSTNSVALEIQVNDSDFPTSQGDSVTVTFFINGSQVGTDTLTANGTASYTHTVVTGGQRQWHAELEDAYGLTATSDTFFFRAPSVLTIRTESEPHGVVNSAEVKIFIAGSNETVDRQTTSVGSISLAGLAIDESYVVVVNATGHHIRSIFLEDIFEQATMFVLNESAPSVEKLLTFVDNTGQFPPESSTVVVEKPINESIYDASAPTQYEWTVVAGARIGSDGIFVIDLRQDHPYRVKVRNEGGDVRSLGELQTHDSRAHELTIGRVTWQNPETANGSRFEAYQFNRSGHSFIRVQYEDPRSATAEFCFKINEWRNASNVLYPEACDADLGQTVTTLNLTTLGADPSTTWEVNWSYTRYGTTRSGAIPIGVVKAFGLPIDEKWLSPVMFVLIVGFFSAIPNRGIRAGSAVIVALSFGLYWWGWVPFQGPELGVAGAIVIIGLADQQRRT